MGKSIRTAVIGVGNMGSAHAGALFRGEIPGTELSAVADVREERRRYAAEAFPGVRVFETLPELLKEDRPDAVIIAVPHRMHAELAAEALRSGCHVLLEKPEDVSVSAALMLNELAGQTDRVFSMMFNQRTNPLFRKAREIVKSGELGELRRTNWIVTNWYRTEAYYRSGGWRATWAGEGGGVLLNQAPHNLDLWQWIAGMPSEVRCELGIGKYHDIEVEDEAAIFVRYENGATGTFLTTTGEYPGTNRFEIAGSRGKLVLEERKLRHWTVEGDEEKYRRSAPLSERKLPVTCEETVLPETEDGHLLVLKNFAEAVLTGTPLLSPGEDGVSELMISNAAYLSAWRQGAPVKLPLGEEDIADFDRRLSELKKTSRFRETETEGPKTADYLKRWSVQW